MKKLISFIILAISIYSCSRKSNHEIDIISYTINMNMDTISRKLDIKTEIEIHNTDTTGKIKFLFCDWIKINKAQINGNDIEFRRNNDTLIINTENYKSINLSFDYALALDSFIQDKQGQVFALTRALKWCPFIYDDISELCSNITVPKGYKVYTSGNLIKQIDNVESQQYKFHNKLNAGLPFVFAPENFYKETVKKQNGTNLKFYFHNPDTLLTNLIINECLLSFEFCTKYIGKYKKPNLTYIELPGINYSQSLETFVLMGSDFINYFGIYPSIRFWPSHETIHQWIGSGYFNTISKNKHNRWFIEESLTEYVRYTFVEMSHGKDSLDTEIKNSIDYYNKNVKDTEQDVSISTNLPNDIVYIVGPLVLHTIRLEIGDSKWQSFISKLYADNYGKVIDYNKFKNTLSLYANPSVIEKMENSMNKKGIPKEYIGQ